MKKYLKENIKSLPFIIITFVMLYSITTFASEYLFNSNEVQYDNSTSGIRSSNVQDAIDELYSCASDYSAYDSRLKEIENTLNNNFSNFFTIQSTEHYSSSSWANTITLTPPPGFSKPIAVAGHSANNGLETGANIATSSIYEDNGTYKVALYLTGGNPYSTVSLDILWVK